MANQFINNNDENKTRDPDLIFAEVAMKRAAKKARERARQVGTGVVIVKDGQIIQEGQETPTQTGA